MTAIFVLATAADCPACVEFKKNLWPGIEKELREVKGLHVVQKEVKSRSDPIHTDLPKDIARFIPYYPSMILITADSWKRGGQLDAIAFNGEIDPSTGKIKRLPKEKIQSYDQLVSWVKNNMPKTMAASNASSGNVLIHDLNEGSVKTLPVCAKRYVGL